MTVKISKSDEEYPTILKIWDESQLINVRTISTIIWFTVNIGKLNKLYYTVLLLTIRNTVKTSISLLSKKETGVFLYLFLLKVLKVYSVILVTTCMYYF